MPHEAMVHGSKTFERVYQASLTALYEAWENPAARAEWGSPDPSVTLRMRAADFSVGGEDIAECVIEGEAAYIVRTRWLDIVPERRILSCETIADRDHTLGSSLISVELLAHGRGSRMVLTVQTVAVEGSGLEEGVVTGWSAALESLAAWLGEAVAEA